MWISADEMKDGGEGEVRRERGWEGGRWVGRKVGRIGKGERVGGRETELVRKRRRESREGGRMGGLGSEG